MKTMKFNVNGREKASYELSNKELVELIKSDTTTEEQRTFLTQKMLERFEYDLCPHDGGETEEDVFVRFFSDFVNGKCHDKHKVAQGMAREHRYLQQEMFKVCMEYIKILAENVNKDYYDPRNEWSCKTSKIMIDHLKGIDYWI